MKTEKFNVVLEIGRGRKSAVLYWTGNSWTSVKDFALEYLEAEAIAIIAKRFLKGVRRKDPQGHRFLVDPELWSTNQPAKFVKVVFFRRKD